MIFLRGERLFLVIAVLIVAAFFFSPSLWKIIKPEKATTFVMRNNYRFVSEEFPQELLFSLKEIVNSQTTDYINSSKVTARHYEIIYSSSRTITALIEAAESYFVAHNFNAIKKEEADDGKVQIRYAQKIDRTANLVIQLQELNAKASMVHINYTTLVK